jgi:hypothetical protein
MSSINAVMNKLFGGLWAPLANLDPWIGLGILSVLFGILALLAMKYCSNQDRIVELKDRYKAHVLAIKLFRDDLRVVLTSLTKTLGLISFYLGHQLRPMAVMMIPFVLVFAQMQMRLAYAPLDVGEEVLVTVELTKAHPGEDAEIAFQPPAGVVLAAKPVRVPAKKKVVYSLRTEAEGVHELKFQVNGETVTKSLHVGNSSNLAMLSPVRSSDQGDLILYPTEPGFGGDSAFSRISLQYPVRSLPLLGLDWSFGMDLGMCISFIIVTMLAAFLLKGFFGVTI